MELRWRPGRSNLQAMVIELKCIAAAAMALSSILVVTNSLFRNFEASG